MPKLNSIFYKPWRYSLTIVFCGVIFSWPAFAIEELDLLQEFGIEVFQTDPDRKAEVKEQRRQDAQDALPPYILPETLAIDAALDAVDLETPAEPAWQAVEHEIAITGLESKECCLRAIRSTRYEVEAQCKTMGLHIWHIESAPVTYNEEEAIQEHKFCKVYYNNITKEALEKAAAENPDEPPPQPDYYLCRARSLAKCFAPTEENATFIPN